MTDTDKFELLESLYAKLPKVVCRGKCQKSCGPILMSDVEERRLIANGHAHPTCDMKTLTCSALKGGRCSIYNLRPMLCRAFGAVPLMPCPWGCKPEGTITFAEERRLMFEIEDMDFNLAATS